MSSTGKRSSRWRLVLVAVILFSSGLGVGILAAPPSSNGVWSGDWIREKYAYFSSGLQLPFTTAGRVLIAGAGGNVTTDSDLSFSGQMLTATDLKFTNDFYWGTTKRTDVLAYPEQAASYVVWVDGATYYAKNGHTGAVTSNADATTVIQACVTALGSGGVIYLKSGTYTITSSITVTSNIQIIGSGISTYLVMGANLGLGIFAVGYPNAVANIYIGYMKMNTGAYNDPSIYCRRVTNIVIEYNYFTGYTGITGWLNGETNNGITIQNNKFDQLRYHAISFNTNAYSDQHSNVKIINNDIENIKINGISIYRTKNIIINGNYLKNVTENAILVEPSSNVDINDNVIVDGILNDTSQAAIYVIPYGGNINNLNINNNIISWTQNPSAVANGIVVESPGSDSIIIYTISINGNKVYLGNYGNCNAGIYIHGKSVTSNMRSVTITGNSIYGGLYGIISTYSKSVVISGNSIYNSTTTGIIIASSIDNIVTSNTVYGCTLGIQEKDASDYNILAHNDLLLSTSALTYVGTHTKISENNGFVTENSGTATIPSGATSIVITHGLSYTPAATDITITWTTVGGLLNCTSWSVTGIGAATFTVNLYDANGAAKGPSGTVTGSWAVRKTP